MKNGTGLEAVGGAWIPYYLPQFRSKLRITKHIEKFIKRLDWIERNFKDKPR